MSLNYQATGIIVKKQPFGEDDILVTFLAIDRGLIKAIAPQARYHKSSLRGKTELLMVNQFSLVKGKNLDRILEMDTIQSYPKLSRNIKKLTISQFLAEVVLNIAMKEQSQAELYTLFNEHLRRIEHLSTSDNIFPYLCQAVFHFLAVTGIAPSIYNCIYTQQSVNPNFDIPHWHIGFSYQGGGIYTPVTHNPQETKLNALELFLLQSLSSKTLDSIKHNIPSHYDTDDIQKAWQTVETTLKTYLEFYLGHALKSARIMTDILLSR